MKKVTLCMLLVFCLLLGIAAPCTADVDYETDYSTALTLAGNDLTNLDNLQYSIELLQALGGYNFSKIYVRYLQAIIDVQKKNPQLEMIRSVFDMYDQNAGFSADLEARGFPSCKELTEYIDARMMEKKGDINGAYAAYSRMNLLDAPDRAFEMLEKISRVTSTPIPKLNAVTGLKATAISTNRIEVTWSKVSRANSYEISWRIHNAASWETATTTSTSYVISNLRSGVSYDIQVSALEGARKSEARSVMDFSIPVPTPTPTMRPKPSSVTNLKATAASSSSIKVSWSSASGAASYEVAWRIHNGSNWTTKETVFTSYTITDNLTAGTSYDIRVTAINSSGKSDTQTVSSVMLPNPTPTPKPTPSSVTNLKATAASSSTIKVSWSSSSGATSYEVAWRIHNSSNWTTKETSFTTCTIKNDLTAGMSYDIRVTAINKSGKSDAQIVSNVMLPNPTPTPKPTPSSVTNLKATAASSSSIKVSWSSSSGAASYEVAWRIHNSSNWTTKETVFTSYTITDNLTAGTSYDIRVTAINSSGKSDAQTITSVMLPNPTPTPKPTPSGVSNLKATATSPSTIKVSWSSSSGATSYEVAWRIHNSSNWTTKETSFTTCTIKNDLTAGMSYDIRVTAINKSGKSDAQTVSNVMLPNPTPTPKPVPEKVTGLRAKSVTSSSVTLSWNSAKNATSYRVYWKRNSETDWQVEGTTSSTSYQVINLYSNAGYDFKVVAERNGEKAADTVLKNVKTSVEAFHDGNLKDTSIKVSIGFRYRDPETDKIMEVKSFVSNTMVQNIRRKNYSYGVYYEFDLPWLATSRYYTMRVDIEAPDGYQRTCYLDEGFSFENLGSSAEWSWSILGENFFSDLFDAYGTIPKGTYTITFYWNDMLVNATSFNVT